MTVIGIQNPIESAFYEPPYAQGGSFSVIGVQIIESICYVSIKLSELGVCKMFHKAFEWVEFIYEKWGLVPAGIIFTLLLVTYILFEGNRQYRRQRFWSQLSLTGKLLYIGFVLGLAAVIVFGARTWKQWKYQKGPLPYTTIDAALADGCLVVQAPGSLIHGKENFEEFLNECKRENHASLTIAIHDGGSIVRVDTLAYDGILYWYTADAGYIHQEPVEHMFSYLIHDVHAPEDNDLYISREVWLLTDNADVSYEDTLLTSEAEFSYQIIFMETEWLDLLP